VLERLSRFELTVCSKWPPVWSEKLNFVCEVSSNCKTAVPSKLMFLSSTFKVAHHIEGGNCGTYRSDTPKRPITEANNDDITMPKVFVCANKTKALAKKYQQTSVKAKKAKSSTIGVRVPRNNPTNEFGRDENIIPRVLIAPTEPFDIPKVHKPVERTAAKQTVANNSNLSATKQKIKLNQIKKLKSGFHL
jgi:hypothetical protein